MISVRPLVILAPLLALVSGCPDKPLPGNEADSTATDTATESGSDTSEVCEDKAFGMFFGFSISIDNVAVDVGEDVDIDRECTVFDDGSTTTLTLSCGDFGFALGHEGEPSAAILDVTDAKVRVRFLQASSWNYASQWLRLDFVGEDLSVYYIAAEPLTPAAGWANPWGLAIGDECLNTPSIDQYAQSLKLERDGVPLELWQGESGQIGDGVQVWVDSSVRSGPDAPAGDGPSSWKELAIVSRGQLAPNEVCDPSASACGPGLACCYPCGIPDGDYVCQAEDPQTMQCPPSPP